MNRGEQCGNTKKKMESDSNPSRLLGGEFDWSQELQRRAFWNSSSQSEGGS